jgi:hypothetical protein
VRGTTWWPSILDVPGKVGAAAGQVPYLSFLAAASRTAVALKIARQELKETRNETCAHAESRIEILTLACSMWKIQLFASYNVLFVKKNTRSNRQTIATISGTGRLRK